MRSVESVRVADLTVAVGERVSLKPWGLSECSATVQFIAVAGKALHVFLDGGVTVRVPLKPDGVSLGHPTIGTTARRTEPLRR